MRQNKNTPLPKELEKDLDLQKMIEHNLNRYLTVSLLTHRARELNEGCKALVEIEGPHTMLETAVAEAKAGLLKVVWKEPTEDADGPVDGG